MRTFLLFLLLLPGISALDGFDLYQENLKRLGDNGTLAQETALLLQAGGFSHSRNGATLSVISHGDGSPILQGTVLEVDIFTHLAERAKTLNISAVITTLKEPLLLPTVVLEEGHMRLDVPTRVLPEGQHEITFTGEYQTTVSLPLTIYKEIEELPIEQTPPSLWPLFLVFLGCVGIGYLVYRLS